MKPLKKIFTEEFTQSLTNGYLSKDPHAIKIITETIERGEGGNLTRLFDKIQISPQTADLMYQKAINASNPSEHIHAVIRVMAKGLLNSDMTGFSDAVIKTLPEGQYDALIKQCGNNKDTLVDYLLKAAAVSYIGLLSAANDRAEQSQQPIFNQQIWPLLSPLSQELNKNKLFPSLYTQVNNFLLSLMPLNASQEKRAAKLLDVGNATIKQLKAHLENPSLSATSCDLIKQSIREINMQTAECQTVLEKYSMLDNGICMINEMSAKDDLNKVCAGMAKAMEGIMPIDKEKPHFLAKLLNKLQNMFTPKTPKDHLSQISQSLKHADPSIREKMHEMKTKIRNVQEIELTEKKMEIKHP